MIKLILGFVLFTAIIYSQNYNRIGDLKKQLEKAESDSVRVDLLNAISFDYFETNSDSARIFSEQAISLAKEIGYQRGEARSLMNLGLVFRNLGNLPKSLELQFKALEILESIGNKHDMSSAYTNIAFSYAEQGDYRHAIEYQFKSLEIDKEFRLDDYLVLDYHNLGDGYEKLGILDSALHFENKAYELAIQNKHEDYLSAVLVNLGNIHLKLGNYDIALPFYRNSSAFSKKFNNYLDMCYSYFGMTELFEKTGNKDSSIHYAKLALTEAEKGNLSLEMLTASNYLASLYEGFNPDSTLKYLKMSVVLKDSIFNQEKIKQLQNLTFAEKIRQQEIAELKAKEELNERKTLQMFVIAIIVVVFIGLLFLFSRLRINVKIIEWLGILALLLMFTYISMLLHSVIKSNEYMPLFSFISVIIISLILKPFNHWVSEWMKEKVIKKNKVVEIPKAKEEPMK